MIEVITKALAVVKAGLTRRDIKIGLYIEAV
jgi:hypothetical protein